MGYTTLKVIQNSVSADFKILGHDFDSVLNVDADKNGELSEAETQKASPVMHLYLTDKFIVQNGQDRCVPEMLGAFSQTKYVRVQLLYKCAEIVNDLRVRSGLFYEADKGFQNIIQIQAGKQKLETILKKDQPEFSLSDAQKSRPFLQLMAQYLKLGIEHIRTGYDHLMFLFGLLLLGGSFRGMLKIVSSFTVAHSITLILSALNVITLPIRFTESMIALSIMYIGVENFFLKEASKRWRITFFFGLVHGFGFASVLRERGLPSQGLVPALLSFNLGVEAGQIAIVALMLPVLFGLTGTLKRYNKEKLLVFTGSAIIFVFGLNWFLQRALNLKIV